MEARQQRGLETAARRAYGGSAGSREVAVQLQVYVTRGEE